MSSDATEIIGRNIRKLRSRLGISQEELAEKSNLHRTYIGGIERGERNITVLNLIKLIKALDCNVNDIFEEVI